MKTQLKQDILRFQGTEIWQNLLRNKHTVEDAPSGYMERGRVNSVKHKFIFLMSRNRKRHLKVKV